MNSNTQFGAYSTLDRQMHAFDLLPSEVRRACWDTAVDFNVVGLLKASKKRTARSVAAEHVAMDMQFRPVLLYAYYGPDHPSAAKYVPKDVLKKLGLGKLGKAAVA